MRNYFFLFFMLAGSVIHAQEGSNRFSGADDQTSTDAAAADALPPGGGPGQDDDNGGLEDDDTVPIDGYAGWLILGAIVVIGLNTGKIKKSSLN